MNSFARNNLETPGTSWQEMLEKKTGDEIPVRCQNESHLHTDFFIQCINYGLSQRATSSFGTTIAQFFKEPGNRSLLPFCRNQVCTAKGFRVLPTTMINDEDPSSRICIYANQRHILMQNQIEEKKFSRKNSWHRLVIPFVVIDEPFTAFRSPFSSQIQEEFLKGASDYANWLRSFASQSSSSPC